MSDEFARLIAGGDAGSADSAGEAGAATEVDTPRTRRRTAVLTTTLVAAALASFVAALWLSLPAGSVPASGMVATSTLHPEAAVPAMPAAATTPPPVGTSTAVSGVVVSTLADAGWVRRTAMRTGIPPRAMAAYAGAALSIDRLHPGCALGWNTLAAIGEVESRHGTIFGGAIGADGVARPRIVGIALDGTSSLAVPDTDGGVLDGDPRWDRALGPMQFIPETWMRDGRDGDGDGRADVDSIDDAALTAADYLCRAGGDLTDPSSWIRAVDAYNPSVDYNHRVAAAADDYAARAG